MAGDWIKMRSDLFTHPKVVRMSSALKADTLRTVGGLMSVWCLFDAHSEDGQLSGYTPEVLDAHLRWSGFAGAMIAVDWLFHQPEIGLSLPRFDTHNGQSAKRRAQDADRKREVRKASAPEADKTRTREEKRREEKREDKGERKRSTPARPEDVSEQTWGDWLQLRKTKRAPVTGTVLDGAKGEAAKAGLPLERFLQIWVMRGSQGLQADWLRADERRTAPVAEPEWRTEQRTRTQQAAPGVAAGAPAAQFFIDVDARPVGVPVLTGVPQ